jgi:hypothetical protein
MTFYLFIRINFCSNNRSAGIVTALAFPANSVTCIAGLYASCYFAIVWPANRRVKLAVSI